ncbi:hypothetical protein EDC04DRAFT_2609167 [Pisolithus marmoratus]|nr:hypothetical protein EDC04DRAFT_2609167 [Pisolithus marmoratus]
MICSQVVCTHESLAPHSSLFLGDMSPSNILYNAPPPAHYNHPPPSRQGYCIPSRTDHRVYHDGPYTNEYYPVAWPAAPCWVNRGGTTQQYEDDFPGDYVEDYY